MTYFAIINILAIIKSFCHYTSNVVTLAVFYTHPSNATIEKKQSARASLILGLLLVDLGHVISDSVLFRMSLLGFPLMPGISLAVIGGTRHVTVPGQGETHTSQPDPHWLTCVTSEWAADLKTASLY